MSIAITDPAGNAVPPSTTITSAPGWQLVQFNTPVSGSYTVELGDGNKSTTFDIAATLDVPVAVLNGYFSSKVASEIYPSGTTQIVPSYFYVPAGTTDFAVYYPRSSPVATALHCTGQSTTIPVTSTCTHVSVAPQMAGKIWWIDRFYTDALLELENVPNLLSPTAYQVMTQTDAP